MCQLAPRYCFRERVWRDTWQNLRLFFAVVPWHCRLCCWCGRIRWVCCRFSIVVTAAPFSSTVCSSEVIRLEPPFGSFERLTSRGCRSVLVMSPRTRSPVVARAVTPDYKCVTCPLRFPVFLASASSAAVARITAVF